MRRRTSALLATLCLALTPALAACGGESAQEIAPADALVFIEQNAEAVVLDVRTPQEFAAGHLPDAVNVSLADDFEEQIADLDQDATYVVYCTTGVRSAEASSIMVEQGFTAVVDAGGIEQLQDAGADVVTD
ncbi:rhodanese-like domain-containing protein [Nocardioidaceae bacterium]|nr:rhodanese-like domain-containing protein [Nocardioidaceae bacterium]